jgi:DegV family protein with EDD domain
MSKIIVSTESCSDIPFELLKEYDIKTIPMTFSIGLDEYYDDGSLSPAEVYKIVEEKKNLPKTSAVTIARYIDFFTNLKKSDDDIIIHVSISDGFSSCYASAVSASQQLPNVYVINSLSLSSGIGIIALRAARLANEGKDISVILDELKVLVTKLDTTFIIDSLEYLHKGGRCSGTKFFLARTLTIKPCIIVTSEGKMGVGKSYIGNYFKNVKKYINDALERSTPNKDFCIITHAGIDQNEVDNVVSYVESLKIFTKVYQRVASLTICSHCGKNTLGIIFENSAK